MTRRVWFYNPKCRLKAGVCSHKSLQQSQSIAERNAQSRQVIFRQIPENIDTDVIGDKIPNEIKRNDRLLLIIGAALFLVIVGLFVLVNSIPPLILALYLIASLLTFIIYAADKSAARRGAWRTPESTLHLLSLAGGWPGALIAQETLRHKSKKASFRFVFWLTVFLNCGVFVWLFTPSGAALLGALIDGAV